MNAIGVFDDFINIVGEGVACLVERIHFERAATLAGNTVIVPPRELGNKDGFVAALHKEIVDGVLEHLLTTIAQQYLFFGDAVDFAQSDTDNALLSLIIDAGVEAEGAGVEVLYGFGDFLGRLKVEFVSVKIVHYLLLFLFTCKVTTFIPNRKVKGKKRGEKWHNCKRCCTFAARMKDPFEGGLFGLCARIFSDTSRFWKLCLFKWQT